MDDQHEAGPERSQIDDPDPSDGTDALLAIRAALDDVDQLPLEERADVFERTHQVVVDELRALELG